LLERKEIYHKKEIVYSIPEDPKYVGEIHVNMAGHHVHVMKLIDGSYSTHFLPFKSYDSMQELTRDVMDKVPYFKMASGSKK
jgi:hypothetical protein